MKRFIAILMTIATALPLVNIPFAQADTTTGPWTWTDLSAQLTERTNRPIWATAYANNNWYYTDGLDLNKGGQVYRYDGSTQVNITIDARNSGISRVDDIVSDGQTVVFLQNVVRLDNQLTAIAYQNGVYTNVTSYVRNALQSNEGISSINGRNGTWYIVTTQGHLFRWNGSTSSPTQIVLPTGPYWTGEPLLYSVNHGSGSTIDHIVQAMLPIANNNWLLIVDPNNFAGRASGPMYFYRYDGSTFNNISSLDALRNINSVKKVASNGSQVFITNNNTAAVTDGSTAVQISAPGNMSNALVAWNGTSWIALNGKDIYRFSGTFANNGSYSSLGSTTDYFDAIASDNNGRFLLGGAISSANNSQPSMPLTAKLTMITEGVSAPVVNNQNNGVSGDNAVTVGGTFGGDRVYTDGSGPQVRIQGNPSGFRVGNGKDFAYRVTASDSNGVDRTDLYINDARIKTCYSDVCEYRTTYWSNGSSVRTVKFWVRTTDKTGYSTDTSNRPDYLYVDPNSSATADGTVSNSGSNNGGSTDSNSGINSWTWLDPNTTTLNANQSVSFNVGAQDANGIKQIDLYANGSVIRSCYLNNATGNQTCSATLYANSYTQGTNVLVNAKITDANNNVSWTTSMTLVRSNDNGSNTGTGNSTGSISTSLSPNVTTLDNNQTVTFIATAQDNDGLNKLEIYANGSVIQTCNVNGTSSQTCSTSLYANNYTQGTNVAVTAKATDQYGNVVWASVTNLSRSTSNSNNNGNSAGSIWTSLSPNTTALNANQSVVFTANAQDNDGLNKIEILVNGSTAQTCSLGNSTGNQTCAATIYATNYTQGTNVFVNARATDQYGNVIWSNSTTLVRSNDTGSNNNGNGSTNGTVSAWSWLEPSGNLAQNASAQFRSGAWAGSGLTSIELWVNGSLKRTCSFGTVYGNQSCDTTIYGSDYSVGTTVSGNVKATDANGQISWSPMSSLSIVNSNGSTNNGNQNTGTAPSVWEWSDPSTNQIDTNGSATYNASAWDQDGVRSITIWVNGSARPTCTFSGSGNQTCNATISGSSYTAGSDIFVNAVATDVNGTTAWTSGKTFHIGSTSNNNGGSSTGSNQNGSVSISTDHANGTYRSNDMITFNTTGSDNNGINRTEIYLNAVKMKTCYGTGSCSLTAGPYNTRMVVTYGATLFDNSGSSVSTGYKQLTLSN